MTPDLPDGDRVARAWVAHLRSGGTTPWTDWVGPAAGVPGAGVPGAGVTADSHGTVGISPTPPAWTGPVPGAVQLELLRRLAVRRREGDQPVTDAAFGALADRVLRRSGPGRGQPDLPLLLPGTAPDVAVGAPPTDPADLPVDELVRVGIGLLADLVLAAGPLPPPERPRRRLLARPRVHLAGAPASVDALRAALAAAGHVEGGRSPQVLLVGEAFDEQLAQVWSTRVQHGAPVRWDTFAGRWARRDALPPSADLPRIAAFWAERVGAARVHVLVAPDLDVATRVLGLRRPLAAATPTDVLSLSAEALDVLRRLNRVLNVRAPQDRREGLVRRARTLLPDRPTPPLALPPDRRDWADRRAREVIGALRSGGYAVHGDLDGIAPRHQGAAAPRRPEVLSLVLETCLRTAAAGRAGASGAGGRVG